MDSKLADAQFWQDKKTTEKLLVLDSLGCLFGVVTILLSGPSTDNLLGYLCVAVSYLMQLVFLRRYPSTYMKYRTGIIFYHRVRVIMSFASEVNNGHLRALIAATEAEPSFLYFLTLFTAWANMANNIFFILPWRWQVPLHAVVAAVQARAIPELTCGLQSVPTPPFLGKTCSILRFGLAAGTRSCTSGATAAVASTFVSFFFGVAVPLCFGYWYEVRRKFELMPRKKDLAPAGGRGSMHKVGVLAFCAVACLATAHVSTYPGILAPAECLVDL